MVGSSLAHGVTRPHSDTNHNRFRRRYVVENTVTLRMIPTYIQVSETLCCDMSRARCFSVSLCCWHLYIFVTTCSYGGMGLSLMTPFKKLTLKDWQLSKDGQNFNPVDDSTKTGPCTSDSSKLSKVERQRLCPQVRATLGHLIGTKIFTASGWVT